MTRSRPPTGAGSETVRVSGRYPIPRNSSRTESPESPRSTKRPSESVSPRDSAARISTPATGRASGSRTVPLSSTPWADRAASGTRQQAAGNRSFIRVLRVLRVPRVLRVLPVLTYRISLRIPRVPLLPHLPAPGIQRIVQHEPLTNHLVIVGEVAGEPQRDRQQPRRLGRQVQPVGVGPPHDDRELLEVWIGQAILLQKAVKAAAGPLMRELHSLDIIRNRPGLHRHLVHHGRRHEGQPRLPVHDP